MPNAPRDAPVKREHRERALRSFGWACGSAADPWMDVGGDTCAVSGDGGYIFAMDAENAAAQEFANCERDVRAAIVERLRELSDACSAMPGVSRAIAGELDALIADLEST